MFPSYMSITSDDAASEIEEERRLAYVGITRAKQHLTITSARTRMIRGETQYNKVSRFVKEIPKELMSGEIYEQRSKDEGSGANSFKKQGRISEKHLHTEQSMLRHSILHERELLYIHLWEASVHLQSANTSKGLDYSVGDRVTHMKFGQGEVKAIIEGGRDYEVTVDFDKAGTKKMFASFAKLKRYSKDYGQKVF